MNILCKYEQKKKKKKKKNWYAYDLFAFLENQVLCATLWEMGPLRAL